MPTHSWRRRTKVALTAGLGALLAGCGGGGGGGGVGDLPPGQIVGKAKQAALSASTAHVTGSINQGEKKTALDVVFVAGTGAKGTITTGDAKFQFRKVEDTVYVKLTRQFLRANGAPPAAGKFQGQYLNVSKRGQNLGPFQTFGSKKQFFTRFLSRLGDVKKVDGTEIRGTPTVGLEQQGGSSVGTLYVATEGKPYPLRLTSSGKSKGRIDFTEYGADATVKAPPQSQVVSPREIRQLGGSSS